MIVENSDIKSNDKSNRLVVVDDKMLFGILSKSYDDVKSFKKLQEKLSDDDLVALLNISKKNLFSKKSYLDNIISSVDDILRPLETELQVRSILGMEFDYIEYSTLFTKLLSSADSCLFAHGYANQKKLDNFLLNDLGIKAYIKCIDLLDVLSNDDELAKILSSVEGPFNSLDDYVSRCAQRFDDYSLVLRYFSKNLKKNDVLTDIMIPAYPDNIVNENNKVVDENLKLKEEYKPSVETRALTLFEPKRKGSMISKEEMTKEEMDLDCYSDRLKVLSEMEQQIYLNMIDFDLLRISLKNKVIGQDEAVDSLVDSFLMQFSGFTSKKKPRNFLAVGPTGVGKNYLFEMLSEEIETKYGVSFSYKEIDCAVLDRHGGINALRGSDKGYVDSDQNGILTSYYFDKVRNSPFSILLFDEFEKAHKKINDFLLPILDKGVIYDSMDRYLDYGSTMITFTSNLGYSDIRGKANKSIGFSASENTEKEIRREMVEDTISKFFTPEFLNRVNIVHFNYLTKDAISNIYELEMKKVSDRYFDRFGLDIIAEESVKELIINKGYSMEFGARFLSKTIDSLINLPISALVQKDVSFDMNALNNALKYIRELREDQKKYESSNEESRKVKSLSEIDIVSAKRNISHLTPMTLPYRHIYADVKDSKIIFEKSRI